MTQTNQTWRSSSTDSVRQDELFSFLLTAVLIADIIQNGSARSTPVSLFHSFLFGRKKKELNIPWASYHVIVAEYSEMLTAMDGCTVVRYQRIDQSITSIPPPPNNRNGVRENGPHFRRRCWGFCRRYVQLFAGPWSPRFFPHIPLTNFRAPQIEGPPPSSPHSPPVVGWFTFLVGYNLRTQTPTVLCVFFFRGFEQKSAAQLRVIFVCWSREPYGSQRRLTDERPLILTSFDDVLAAWWISHWNQTLDKDDGTRTVQLHFSWSSHFGPVEKGVLLFPPVQMDGLNGTFSFLRQIFFSLFF